LLTYSDWQTFVGFYRPQRFYAGWVADHATRLPARQSARNATAVFKALIAWAEGMAMTKLGLETELVALTNLYLRRGSQEMEVAFCLPAGNRAVTFRSSVGAHPSKDVNR